jgi:hypothetical protein
MTLGAMKSGQLRFLMKKQEGTSLRGILKHDPVKTLKNYSASPIDPASDSFSAVKNARETFTRKNNTWNQRSNPSHWIQHL